MTEGGQGPEPRARRGAYRSRVPGGRSKVVRVRVSDGEWEAIVQAGAAAGMSGGAYLARAAEAIAADRPLVPEAVMAELRQARRQLHGIGTNVNQLAAAANSGAALDRASAEAVLASVVPALRRVNAVLDRMAEES